MLPKINRLKKNKDIKRVLEKGRRFKEDFLILKILPSDLKETKFAFIVSQKFARKATLRNKMKRKLREQVRRKFKKIKSGFDIIIIAMSGLETKGFWEIDEAIDELFKKAKIIKP